MNERGEVIGVNTAIIGGAQGLGFAIPINTAQDIAQELVVKGSVDHPYVGIQMRTLTPAVREVINAEAPAAMQINRETGVVILGVQRDSPAAETGLRPGDVILSMAGQSVEDAETVQKIVQATEIGAALTVEIDRQGQIVELTVNPAALPLEEYK